MPRIAIALAVLTVGGLFTSQAIAAPDDLLIVSRGFDGRPGNANLGWAGSEQAYMSADGRRVAFRSGAPNMVPGLPDNNQWQVYVRDLVAGTTVLVSRGDGPKGAISDNGGSLVRDAAATAISADGRYVYFLADLGAGLLGYRRDVDNARTLLVTRADGLDGAPLTPGLVSASADNRHVAFQSGAAIYLRDVETGRTELVSRKSGPEGAPITDMYVDLTGLSSGGRYVAFRTAAPGVAPGVGDVGRQIYLRDVRAGRTVLVSRADGPGGAPASDNWAGPTPVLAGGCRVAFDAKGHGLADGSPSNGGTQSYVRDLCTNTTTLVSRADGPGGAPAVTPSLSDAPDASTYVMDQSADGRYVLFETAAGNLASGLRGGVPQYYVRDLVAGRTRLVSRAAGADGAPDRDNTPHYVWGSLTPDARYVAFASAGQRLTPEANGWAQVYRRELGELPAGTPPVACGPFDDPGLGGTPAPPCPDGTVPPPGPGDDDDGNGTKTPTPRPIAVGDGSAPASTPPASAPPAVATTPTLIRAPTLRTVRATRTRVTAWIDLPATLEVRIAREILTGKRRGRRALRPPSVTAVVAKAGTARVALPRLSTHARYRLTVRALGTAGARSATVIRTIDLRKTGHRGPR
jgi:hypothetical protein